MKWFRIAYFKFKKAIKPIRKYFDVIMTGYKAGCDKTNPKMYKKLVNNLNEAVEIIIRKS